ncbi:acylase [Chlorogloeopsis fritschii PCC 9212]|uniref:7-beta-(4-carbaxybutanamido)cephalosporanic acid acylase n=1 Tax=Chlorogloeopsis fritschii PCC 6912 TaxID=211165 RepID=A0A433N6C5_CHLFR|nr:acylase [Chlorogloeopsis fritschii]RUR77033.1 7-beta-(4-carbaxybutanamido)cephalosporanic acid acylase [Chlorogloeopsis fritschii PCC 6912]
MFAISQLNVIKDIFHSGNRRYTSKFFHKKSFRILAFILSALLALAWATPSLTVSLRTTEILWDTYGVPHIYAKDAANAFKAFGWAQMQSHGNLLLRLYGQARGRAAEYWGEEYLESDRWVLTVGVPERSRSWYKAQTPTFRSYLDAFAAGVNAYAKEHPDLIDDEVKAVLPVKPEDVLAHLQRVLYFTFVVSPERIAGTTEKEQKPGSNGWAIAPKKSASGKAMLLANPHLPWADLFLWYEAQINAPGIDAYGATLVGVPVLAIAFNDNLGWTHTVNTHDGWDAYELKLAGKGYRFDGQIRPFQTKTISLKIKQKDGTLREQPLVVKSSVHGPVVSEKDGKVLALRVVGLDRPGVLEQWWDMARAKNLSEFETALKRLQLPMFTVMYADRAGNIMHLFNGQVPVHQEGDFEYWQGTIPGNTSKTLWTKIHPYQDLPRVLNPKSGWLQNANDPPWTTTFPVAIKADNYPSYMAPQGPMDFRAQRSARMLAEDPKISFDEMVEYKHSTRMELADRILDDLISAAQKQGSELAQRAAKVLAAWDRQANADSRGAVLFATWAEEMDLEQAFSQPWNDKSPRTTPKGLANPTSAAATLEAAAVKVEKAYGKLDVPWGEVFRLKYGNVDLPANGGYGELGIFRVVDFVPNSDGGFQSFAGDSYIAAIEFSNPVRAMALTSYGNATQPNSPHKGDQLQMFAQQQLHPVWRNMKDIKAHLAERKEL